MCRLGELLSDPDSWEDEADEIMAGLEIGRDCDEADEIDGLPCELSGLADAADAISAVVRMSHQVSL